MSDRDMRNLSEQILARIDEANISPTPRWHFLLRDGVVCTVGLVSMTVGALAVVAVIFEMRNAWWEQYEATHESLLTFAIEALPLIWILTLLLFSFLLYESVRRLRRGYRYAIGTIILATVGVSSVAGIAGYLLGAGPFADEWVGGFVPYHRPLIERERERWMDLDDGRLAGIIREIPYAEPSLWLEGVDGDAYRVDLSDFTQTDRGHMRVGDHVRIVGVPTTTPAALHGCVIFVKAEDILERAHAHETIGIISRGHDRERKPLIARSRECEGIKPYARLVPDRD